MFCGASWFCVRLLNEQLPLLDKTFQGEPVTGRPDKVPHTFFIWLWVRIIWALLHIHLFFLLLLFLLSFLVVAAFLDLLKDYIWVIQYQETLYQFKQKRWNKRLSVVPFLSPRWPVLPFPSLCLFLAHCQELPPCLHWNIETRSKIIHLFIMFTEQNTMCTWCTSTGTVTHM